MIREMVAPSEFGQRLQQLGACRLQFSAVGQRQLPEQFFSAAGGRQQHAAPVVRAARPPQQAFCLEAIHQFDSTVMLHQQPLREHPYRGRAMRSLECKKRRISKRNSAIA